MGFYSWLDSKSKILGVWNTVLGAIVSIIAIGEFVYGLRGYMSDNSINVLLMVTTIFSFIVMCLFAYRSVALWTAANKSISELKELLHDATDENYKEGNMLDRQLNHPLIVAIAKNGVIPRTPQSLVTKLNKKDVELGERLKRIENDLKKNGFS